MKNKVQKLLKSGIEIIKNNKLITVIILISLLSIYFWGIRPYQIRKECSTTIKYNASYQYTNPEYNETAERQKQKMLVDYIECRNNNLANGDQIYVKMNGNNPYTPTQGQYNTLSVDELIQFTEAVKFFNHKKDTNGYKGSLDPNFDPKVYCAMFGACNDLEKLNQYALGKLSPLLYHTYNGYIIDNPTYDKLKANKDKYPKCIFPDDFVKKELSGGGGEYTTNATDTEYKTCLRKNGLKDDKKPTAEEVRKDKNLCYQWYGKECDDPNFNPE